MELIVGEILGDVFVDKFPVGAGESFAEFEGVFELGEVELHGA